jgi:hypothetical protein
VKRKEVFALIAFFLVYKNTCWIPPSSAGRMKTGSLKAIKHGVSWAWARLDKSSMKYVISNINGLNFQKMFLKSFVNISKKYQHQEQLGFDFNAPQLCCGVLYFNSSVLLNSIR